MAMNWEHLIAIALLLAGAPGHGATAGRPRQANLRRAVSTAYYAMFHALANSNANTLIGTGYQITRSPEWTAAHRALNHGTARTLMSNTNRMSAFHQHIVDFSAEFVTLQAHRTEADYNPNPSRLFTRSDAIRHIRRAQQAIDDFLQAPEPERRAFAAYLLFARRN